MSKIKIREGIMNKDRKAQVSLYVIIAMVIVAGVLIYFLAKEKTSNDEGISLNLIPVFQYYESCIELVFPKDPKK